MNSDPEQLAALERRIAALESAMRELNRRVGAMGTAPETDLASAAAPRPTPRSGASAASDPYASAAETPRRELPPRDTWVPTPRSELARRWASYDLEALVGRYGTLVLATVSALAAVGTFLGWAIANGLLGPSQRIGLGLVTATGLAVGGMRLRRRERSFGASLLGLALAVVHVCAWGAGPSLRLVPSWVAFTLAAVASIVLAAFAHSEDDEPLWSVGFSGAIIAPFVTSSGSGNLPLLAAYGAGVMAASGFAMGGRRWIVAGRLFLLAALAYTAALATGHERDGGPLLAMAFPLAVAVTGVVPWVAGWARRERLRALGVLAALAALRTAMAMQLRFDAPTVAAMIAAAGVLWLVLVDRTHATSEQPTSPLRRLYEGDWLDAGVVPLAFVTAGVGALDASARGSGLAMAGAAAVLLITVARLPRGALRDAAVFATVLCALVATLLIGKGKPIEITGTVAVLAAACFAGNRIRRSVSWTTMGLLGFVWVVLACLGQLAERVPYEYTPLATRPSLVSFVALVALIVARALAADEGIVARLLGGAILVWAFLWLHQEIMFAFNPTAATLLRVSYYAVTSVAAVGAGRARDTALLRHVGLGLAVVAAATALYRARHLGAIGARIGADLVAAAFLLAIAYWYRKPGARPLTAAPGDPTG